LCTWLANLSFLDLYEFEGVELAKVDAFVGLCWIGFDGTDTWLSTCFLDLNVWTTLHWFNYWSWATLVWLEFLGFVRSWLGKVSLGLSLSELASWLSWISYLDMAWVWLLNSCPCFAFKMFGTWSKIFVLFSKSVIFFQQKDFRRKSVKLG